MRILLIYPGHAFSTRDVASGYERALTAVGHAVQAYAYHDSLSFYSAAIEHWRKLGNGRDWPDSAAHVLASERAVIEVMDFIPDVVLAVHGMALHPRAYDLIRQLGVPVFLMATESPYLDAAQARLANRAHVAGILTNDAYSVDALHTAGGLPVAYLPHSYDPAVHYPREVTPGYAHDVFFYGTLWPERRAMFAALQAYGGCRVDIGGLNHDAAESFEFVPNDELARHYCGSKIAVNHHRTIIGGNDDGYQYIQPGAAWSLGPRAYEIAACGAFQLCDDARGELTAVFGDSVPAYSDGEDLTDKVRYWLAHDDERQAAAAAALTAVQGCTFTNRAADIVTPFIEKYI